MKSLITLVFGFFVVFCAFAQEEQATADGPAITFEETSFDFGDIYQGDKVEHTFKLENTGTQPLIITNVQTTCGCTATEWPREPILPGESASLKVDFNSAGKYGRQNKVISVISNATSPMNQVKIIANVLPKKD
ncbi:MAG: DUF1573 domain-containing protein [Bacteroidetes bacterium]|nr:MAG: DUF1573 domain-containing protein [Bacteroidota bacterium]